MQEFNNIIKLISTLRNNCPSDKKRTSQNIIDCLKKELEEVNQAIENKNQENLIEELGDLLFNVLFLIDIESENKNIKLERILEKLNNKMIFRHPHIFENKREVTIEQADKIWKEQKLKEKELNIIH